MKHGIKSLFLIAAFLLLLSGCGVGTAQGGAAGKNPDGSRQEARPGQKEPLTNARVALVTDGDSDRNAILNRAALKGMQSYADAVGVSFTRYGAYDTTHDSCKSILLTAIQNDAELVICVGTPFEQAVGELQDEYENVCFLLLGGVPRDSAGEALDISANVHCISWREQEAGYLAGYMAVLEGYRRFGFIGGERVPCVERYGQGFLSGIDDAARSRRVSGRVSVKYWYADTFSPDERIEEVSGEWYEEGTEIIFACGGRVYESVLSAAGNRQGMLIVSDADLSDDSQLFLTSALKGVDSAMIRALDEFIAGGRSWPEELSGKTASCGAREGCAALPVGDRAWRFGKATMEEYLQVLSRLRAGEIQISTGEDTLPQTAVSVTQYSRQEERDS